jgi:hypothetical protein
VAEQNSDLLRAIGAFLDEQEQLARAQNPEPSSDGTSSTPQPCIKQVNLVRHGETLSVSWRTWDRDSHRSLSTEQVTALAYLGSQLRTVADETPGGWKELMRTLGQLLDAGDLRVDGLLAWGRTFYVAGEAGGERQAFQYTEAELRTVSELRQLLRRPRVA